MGRYFETDKTELKVRYSNTICKEIVAFLNTEGGQIIIGVADDGEVVGVENLDDTMQKISDVVTAQIEPNPQDEVRTEVKFDQGKTLVVIQVPKGYKHLYCIKKFGFSSNGCAMRIGTSCKSMTTEQIKVRFAQNFYDDEYLLKKRASRSDLSFRTLQVYYVNQGYQVNESAVAANFNLRNTQGEYNYLAELLADRNSIPLIYVRFAGTDKTALAERNDYGNVCILWVYEMVRTRLATDHKCLVDTEVRPREELNLFDFNCANEALLNALVHNDWTQNHPLIALYADRLEFLSYGGLPRGLTQEDFYAGVSYPRNPTLMRIFSQLNLTEQTGHGVPLIISKYGKEAFEIKDNYLKCTLRFDPEALTKLKHAGQAQTVVRTQDKILLNSTEQAVIKKLLDNATVTAQNLAAKIGVTRRTIERALANLKTKGIIERIGSRNKGSWLVVKAVGPAA
ncbi:MAG: putative DNA binding domain-containing protein [Succinivibrio sp.]|nr:putative DNA binding domain-containing protein [Succinivibrio sp.]